jgi:broad specificity phosphatase PhoE
MIMKKLIVLVLLMMSFLSTEAQQIELTTYYFIRHAEKDRSDGTNKNPELTAIGHQRAMYWSEVFKNVPFDMVFSTDYLRTQQTAAPTAMKKGLDLKSYDPKEMYSAEFQKITQGKTVLIVGHSNTTPAFVNKVLGEHKYKDIDDSNNGNLYIVVGTADGFDCILLNINPN